MGEDLTLQRDEQFAQPHLLRALCFSPLSLLFSCRSLLLSSGHLEGGVRGGRSEGREGKPWTHRGKDEGGTGGEEERRERGQIT
jgi:hypothetical protein